VKNRIALCVAAAVLGFAAPQPALAQAMTYPPGYPGYPGVYPVSPRGVPPYEAVTIVRSAGFEPLSRPQRQGPVYVVRAADGAGRVMQVFVDARLARVVRVAPARRDETSPYPSPPAPVPGERVLPDGNGAARGPGSMEPPDSDGPIYRDEHGSAPGDMTRSVARAAPKPSSPAPMPRPRPATASAGAPPAGALADAGSNPPPVGAPAPPPTTAASASVPAPVSGASSDLPSIDE
jgi:hypothetical protein